ncbi:MAG: FAD-dependent oxidoreductase [Christensenella sp.]|nr:FAD-dependent oxidoreductase [Christensenella sp.]
MNKIDENAPEYYALASIVSDEQAEIAIAAGLRKNRTAAYLAEKTGKSQEDAHRLALELAEIGVFRVNKDANGEDQFYMQIFAPGIMEMLVNNPKQLAEHPEVGRAFEEYTRIRMATMSPMLPMGSGLMRVIPIESSIDGNMQAVPYERISYYLDKYDIYSVSSCSCRAARRTVGEGCGHLEQDMCIQMGKGAEYYIRTGRARQVSRAEVEELLRKAEENGLMHNIPNIEEVGETAAICNCCACACFGLRVGLMFGARDAVRSNYVAKVDAEKCVACGQCVENCPGNALMLGQKLCTKTPVTAMPEVKKITEHAWSKADWNVDYRENRKDVVDSGTAPCKTACPAHIAIQGYIKLAAQGKYMDALELIKKENPFPAICGRICNRRCESECTRGEVDEPIAIDEVKKFIADTERKAGNRFIPKKRYDCSDKKIAIVGAGPAGLACAYFLALDNYDITVFEKEERLGGMLTMGIPSFRLEKEVVDAEIEVLKELGVKFKTGVEVGKDVTLDELRAQGYRGFYLAIGAQGGRKIGIEGEDAAGVLTGIEFLRNVNLGKDAKLPGKVVVIGGGNVAIDVARAAVRESAESVTMLCLESAKEMPALPEEIAEAKAEGIQIQNGWGPKRILVENGKVTGVEFKKCTSVFEDGKFAPKYDENETITVSADYVLLSIGQSILWGDLLKGTKVELGRGNTAVADGFTYQTAQADIFVGGDCYSGPKFAIDAIAAGKEAAISLHRFVQPGQTLTAGRDRRVYRALDKENLVIESYDNTRRQQPEHEKANERSFRDTRLTFTEEQLKKETERCLGCGATVVDEYLCVGCGQCTTKCRFDAITLYKKYDRQFPEFEKMPIEVAKHVVKRTAKIASVAVKDLLTQK